MISPQALFSRIWFLIHDAASTEIQFLIASLVPQFHRL